MTQKEKIKHERVLKLKKIGFWTLNIVSYILAGIFLIVLIISLSTPKKQNVAPRGVNNLYQEQITEVINDIPNNVVYDDTNYTITLSVNELNEYTWEHLTAYGLDASKVVSGLCGNNNSTQVFNNGIVFVIEEINYRVIFPNSNFQGKQLNIWGYYDYDGEEYLEFNNNLTINIAQSYYNDIKSAIELDIQSNETSETQTIFESISQVLTNFITTLNSGITSVLNLFWNSTTSQLTLLGNLSTIVIGVAVCFFLFRLVIGLIRLRG